MNNKSIGKRLQPDNYFHAKHHTSIELIPLKNR